MNLYTCARVPVCVSSLSLCLRLLCVGSFRAWATVKQMLDVPPAYFYTQPGATGPGSYDNMAPQDWQDGSAVTGDLFNPHQQTFDQPGNAVLDREVLPMHRMLWQV